MRSMELSRSTSETIEMCILRTINFFGGSCRVYPFLNQPAPQYRPPIEQCRNCTPGDKSANYKCRTNVSRQRHTLGSGIAAQEALVCPLRHFRSNSVAAVSCFSGSGAFPKSGSISRSVAWRVVIAGRTFFRSSAFRSSAKARRRPS